MSHVWGTGEVYVGFSWGDLMERDHLEDLGLDRIILTCIFDIWNGEAWTGLL